MTMMPDVFGPDEADECEQHSRKREGPKNVEVWMRDCRRDTGGADEENPTKPARSTVGVAALVVPDWLIEIEAFAVFPE